MGAPCSNRQGGRPLTAETPGAAAVRMGQRVGASPTHSSYTLPEEDIREWENGVYCSVALLAHPSLGTWNLLSMALPPPLDIMYCAGKTGSLSFRPTLSAYYMLNAR